MAFLLFLGTFHVVHLFSQNAVQPQDMSFYIREIKKSDLRSWISLIVSFGETITACSRVDDTEALHPCDIRFNKMPHSFAVFPEIKKKNRNR